MFALAFLKDSEDLHQTNAHINSEGDLPAAVAHAKMGDVSPTTPLWQDLI